MSTNAVAHERRVRDVHARALEHRLELLAHDADTDATTSGASALLASSSSSVSSAPQRAIQRATSQRGCECCSASASTGSVGRRARRARSRSRSSRRSTAFTSLLAPMPCRRFASSTVCAIAAYAGTLPMTAADRRRAAGGRSDRDRAARSPPRTRSRAARRASRAGAASRTRARASSAGRARSSRIVRRSNALSSSSPPRRSVQHLGGSDACVRHGATHRHRWGARRRSPVEHPRRGRRRHRDLAPRHSAREIREPCRHPRQAASRSPCAPDPARRRCRCSSDTPSTPCSITIARVGRGAHAGIHDHRHAAGAA